MDRKCSMCGKLGHNSRTCTNRRGIRLFGVRLDISSSANATQKSFIMDFMNSPPSSSSSLPSSRISVDGNSNAISFRQFSDARAHGALQESTKGQWTDEEHRAFLKGLEKLGKGNWRGISRSYVKTRTATQVASHAQKYFLRKKRRTAYDLVHPFSYVERKNKVVHPKREDLDPTLLPLLVSGLFGSPENFSSAGKTSSPNDEPDLELTLNTIPKTSDQDHCESTSI